MRRMGIVGLCLVAALACGAMLASAAQAAEVGECLKLAKVEGVFHGKYVDKNCQVAATPLQEAEGKHNKWGMVARRQARKRQIHRQDPKSVELISAAGAIALPLRARWLANGRALRHGTEKS